LPYAIDAALSGLGVRRQRGRGAEGQRGGGVPGGSSTARARASRAPLGMTGGGVCLIKKNHPIIKFNEVVFIPLKFPTLSRPHPQPLSEGEG
jgi:hypothetical protein